MGIWDTCFQTSSRLNTFLDVFFSLQEPRPLYNRRCQFYSSGVGFLYDAYQTEVNKFASSYVHSSCVSRGWGEGRQSFENVSVHEVDGNPTVFPFHKWSPICLSSDVCKSLQSVRFWVIISVCIQNTTLVLKGLSYILYKRCLKCFYHIDFLWGGFCWPSMSRRLQVFSLFIQHRPRMSVVCMQFLLSQRY